MAFVASSLTSVTPTMLWELFLVFGTAAAGAVLAWLTTRKSVFNAIKAQSDTWQGLAEAREVELERIQKQLEQLKTELHLLRTQNDTLQSQNAQLQALNLTLQQENLTLRSQIAQLQDRVLHLEAMRRPEDRS